MTQTIDEKVAGTPPETDLVAATLQVLAASPGPLTISKIRAKLQAPFRSASLEELTETLQRQARANVFMASIRPQQSLVRAVDAARS